MSIQKVCEKTGRDVKHIWGCCKEFNVTLPKQKKNLENIIKIASMLLEKDPCLADVGRKCNISREYVRIIYQQMITCGIVK